MVHYQYDLSGRAQLFVAFFFFFNDTATTEIYTLSLHDALPISQETPIGYVPAKNGLTLDGVKISNEALSELLRVNPEDWDAEMEDSKQFLGKFGNRLPRQIAEEHEKLARRFQRVVTA